MDMKGTARAYQQGKYEFPDEELLSLCPDRLRGVIRSNLKTATDHVDGIDGLMPEIIDHAQDLIEQARDLLLDKGVTFTDAEIEDLRFLSWPLTELEQAEQEAQRNIEKLERTRLHALWKQVENQALAATAAAIGGELKAGNERLSGIRLKISGRPGASEASGKTVLSLVDELHALNVHSAKLGGWTCSKHGHNFETDPSPAWDISMSLPTQQIIWLYLWAWFEKHRISACPIIEFDWQDGNQPRCNWAYLAHLWPELIPGTFNVLKAVTAHP